MIVMGRRHGFTAGQPGINIMLVLVDDGFIEVHIGDGHIRQITLAELPQNQVQLLGAAMLAVIAQALTANFSIFRDVFVHDAFHLWPQHITYPLA